MSNLATITTQAGPLEMQQGFGSQSLLMDFEKIRAMQALADMMAGAAIAIPQHFRGKPADCLAVVMKAAQWGMNPFDVAGKTHVVNGQLGFEAQLINAIVQTSGAIQGRFHYEYRGDGQNVECRVGATIRGEREITWGEWLNAASVTTKNSPLWKTNPKQQLGYLQVKNWSRAYTPGAILGVYSDDELEDMPARDMGAAEVVTEAETVPPANTRTQALKEQLGAGAKHKVTLQQVLDGLEAATTPEELLAAAELAKKLQSSGDKKTAGDAYLARLHALKEATTAQTIDQSTGEIHDPDDDMLRDVEQAEKNIAQAGQAGKFIAPTYAQVADKINKAANEDDLAAAADLIQYVESEIQQRELGAVYKAKAAEFKGK